MIKVSTTGMAVSLKTDLRFPISGQWGHGDRIIQYIRPFCKLCLRNSKPSSFFSDILCNNFVYVLSFPHSPIILSDLSHYIRNYYGVWQSVTICHFRVILCRFYYLLSIHGNVLFNIFLPFSAYF